MNRFAERQRGVILQVLDMSKLEAEALEFRQKGMGSPGDSGYIAPRPDCYQAKIYGGKTAIHKSKNGHLYSICTEGVGYTVSDEDPLEVQFHGSYYMREDSLEEDLLGRNVPGPIKSGAHTFDVMPFGSVSLTPEELKSYPVAEEVDLADFVRTFGSRLESNFWNWFEELTSYEIRTK